MTIHIVFRNSISGERIAKYDKMFSGDNEKELQRKAFGYGWSIKRRLANTVYFTTLVVEEPKTLEKQ